MSYSAIVAQETIVASEYDDVMMIISHSTPHAPPRRRVALRFSLRTLLAAMTVCAIVALLLLNRPLRYEQRKRAAEAMIIAAGGKINASHASRLSSPGSNLLSRMVGIGETFESLWEVDLSRKTLPRDRLKKLRGCEWIRRIDLSGTDVGDDDINDIVTLKKLNTLKLANTKVTDAGVQRLTPLGWLLLLDVSGNDVAYSTLDKLESGLRRAPRVRHVNLQEQHAIASLHEHLVDPARPIVPGDPDELGLFTLMPTAHVLRFEKRQPPLTLTPPDIDHIRHLTHLKQLSFWDVTFPTGEWKWITDLKDLETLTINGGAVFMGHEGGNFGDADLAWVAQLPKLKFLALASNHVSDEALAKLQGTKLESLNLFLSARTTPRVISQAARIKSLRELHLNLWRKDGGGHYGPRSTEERALVRKELEHLQELPRLEHLALQGNLMADDVVEPLKQLTRLTELNFDKDRLSQAKLDELKAALPKCKIVLW